MLIFKDIFSGEEILSDSFPMEIIDDVVYKVKGKTRSDKTGIDDSLIGANASAEGADGEEGADDSAVSGINIVLNHHLVAGGMDKKQYMVYIKGYMKRVKEHMQQNGKSDEEISKFEKNIGGFIKGVLKEFGEYEFYQGESYDEKAMQILVKWDEETPYFYYFIQGLDEEKV